MENIVVLGFAGNIGMGLLSFLDKIILNEHEVLSSILKNSILHCIDIKDCDKERSHLNIKKYQVDIYSNTFEALLKEINPSLIIDCSDVYWDRIFPLIDNKNIKYINTAIEDNNSKAKRCFDFIKQKSKWQIKGIIGAGANSGWVQWVAKTTIEKYGNHNLTGIYIIEKDTGIQNNPQDNTIYLTWNLYKYLDETLVSHVYFDKGEIVVLPKNSFNYLIPVKINEEFNFSGALVSHDETLELSEKYKVESSYIYEINTHSLKILEENFKDTYIEFIDSNSNVYNEKILSIFKNKGFRIYNADHTVKGKDYLGNLFVYNDKQIAVYEVEDHENCIKEYDMNATVYQVVCGLYAGICSLLLDPLTNEIYMITDLIYTENNKYGDYLTKHLRNWFEEITYDNQIALKKYLHSLTR